MAENSLKSEAFKLIARSKENLEEMNRLLEYDLYFGAVNRGYYALFHAISALVLFLDGKEFSSHKALISYLKILRKNRECSKTLPQRFNQCIQCQTKSRL